MRNLYLILSAVLVGLIVALLALNISFEPEQSYAYSFTQENIVFASNEAEPAALLKDIAQQDSFFLVLETRDKSPLGDAMGKVLVLYTVVLTGNSKDVVSVFKVLDASGSLESCQTNYGYNKSNESISAESCLAFLQDTGDAALIEIQLPKARAKSKVIVSANRIVIQPNTGTEIGRVSSIVLQTLYPNAQSIVNQVNDLSQTVS